MNTIPKISIVTPTFNQGNFIEETILSVIGQNYSNLEYIIIDGGSTDGTIEVIKKYERNLAFWVSEKDKGQSHAINKGFAKATGNIFMWLNSDDFLMPGALRTIAEKTDVEGLGIYFGNCIHFKHQNGVTSWGSDVVQQHKNFLLENADYIIQPSSFWTKKTWLAIGELNEELHYTFDWEWFLKAKNKNVPFIPVSECLSLYRIHPDHKTGTGGSARDKEIAGIYKIYKPSNETLFNYLLEDKYYLIKKYWITLKKIASVLYTIHDVELLKMLKPSKYKRYSDDTIEQVKIMVTDYY